MTPDPVVVILELFWLVFYGSAPALLTAALAGLVIAILQGVMQINDQSLPQAVKTILTMLVLVSAAGFSFGPLRHALHKYLEMIPIVAQ